MYLVEFPKEKQISIADLYSQTKQNYPKSGKISYGQGPITSGGAAHDKSLSFDQVVTQNREFTCALAKELPNKVNDSEWMVLAHLMGKREHWVDGELTTLRGNEFLYIWSGVIAGMDQDTFVQYLRELANSRVKPAAENEQNHQFRWRQYVLLHQFTDDFTRRNRDRINPAQNIICFPDSFSSMGSRYEQNLAKSLNVAACEVKFVPNRERLQEVGIWTNAVFQCLLAKGLVSFVSNPTTEQFHGAHPVALQSIGDFRKRRQLNRVR